MILGKLDWTLEAAKEKARCKEWSLHYTALLEYYKEHNTCNVPPSESYECELPNMGDDGGDYHYNQNLGKWLYSQKQAMNGKGTLQLTSEQKAQLQLLVDQGKIQIHIVRSNSKMQYLFFNMLLKNVKKCISLQRNRSSCCLTYGKRREGVLREVKRAKMICVG